jgi:hypothetical protein
MSDRKVPEKPRFDINPPTTRLPTQPGRTAGHFRRLLIVRKVSGTTGRGILGSASRKATCYRKTPLTDFAPFMIHEALPTLTETALGSIRVA